MVVLCAELPDDESRREAIVAAFWILYYLEMLDSRVQGQFHDTTRVDAVARFDVGGAAQTTPGLRLYTSSSPNQLQHQHYMSIFAIQPSITYQHRHLKAELKSLKLGPMLLAASGLGHKE